MKITARNELTTIPNNAVFPVVDVDDSTEAETGTLKKASKADLMTAANTSVAATPSNYAPSSATVEGHLAGIDTALESGGGGGGGFLSLKATASVTDSTTGTLSVSGLDLHTDKAYKIFIWLQAPSTGTAYPIISLLCNGITSGSPYYIQRIDASDTSVTGTRTGTSSRNIGLSIPVGDAQLIEINVSQSSTGLVRGVVYASPMNGTSGFGMRSWAFIFNSTDNLTSFGITDPNSAIDVGSAIRVATLGF